MPHVLQLYCRGRVSRTVKSELTGMHSDCSSDSEVAEVHLGPNKSTQESTDPILHMLPATEEEDSNARQRPNSTMS